MRVRPRSSPLCPYTTLFRSRAGQRRRRRVEVDARVHRLLRVARRSEEHTSELQSHLNLECRLLLEKKNNIAGRATMLLFPARRLSQSYCLSRTRSSAEHIFFNDSATTEIYTLSLHDALPI